MRQQDLLNKLESIRARADRLESEFKYSNPDIEACDSMIRSMWSDIGDILKQRKAEGWPTPKTE